MAVSSTVYDILNVKV